MLTSNTGEAPIGSDIREGIAYDIREGIGLAHYNFTNGVVSGPTWDHLSPHEYKTLTAKEMPGLAHVAAEIEHGFLGGKPGEKIHSTLINREIETPRLVVAAMNWGGYFQNPHATREFEYLARTYPDAHILTFDHPGSGSSDVLPRYATDSMKATGRHTEYGGIVLRGIDRYFEDYDVIDFIGPSQGGLVLMEAVAQMNRPAHKMVVRDSPVADPRPFPSGMIKSFIRAEGAHAKAYMNQAIDLIGIENQRNSDAPKSLALGLVRSIKAHGLRGPKTQWWDMPRAMSQGTLGETIEATLPNVSDAFSFISPVYSELNWPEGVTYNLRMATLAVGHTCKVQQVMFNGTHAFALGTPAASIALDTHVLGR